MIQLILHLVGDYLTQSDWMAQTKTKASFPAFCHALVYSLPFLFIGSREAVVVILVTHFFIDRYRLARYVVWAKNHLAPATTSEVVNKEVSCVRNGVPSRATMHVWETTRWWQPWSKCSKTGYPETTPDWLAVWLLIAADNTLHLAINAAALAWL